MLKNVKLYCKRGCRSTDKDATDLMIKMTKLTLSTVPSIYAPPPPPTPDKGEFVISVIGGASDR